MGLSYPKVYQDNFGDLPEGDITKGHAVLSESQGIMLLYDLEKNDRDKFFKLLEKKK